MSREITPEQLAELQQMRDDLRRGLDDFDRRFARRQIVITLCMLVSCISLTAIAMLSLLQTQGAGPFPIAFTLLSFLGLASLGEVVYLGFPSSVALDWARRERMKNLIIQLDLGIHDPSENATTVEEVRASFPRLFEMVEDNRISTPTRQNPKLTEQPLGGRK